MPTRHEIIINAKNISKRFGDILVLNNVNFEVLYSSCFGFLGPNGAGKTTLMSVLFGRVQRDNLDESLINVLGSDPAKDSLKIKYVSGVVPQENNLDEELNLFENLLIYSKFYAIGKKAANERINHLLEFVELSDKKKSRIKELSGGMKRRLIIARALLNNPKLLILDEPTTGLDPQVKHLIWDKIRQLKKDGVTILLSTHYMEEAFQLCDNIMIMDHGQKVVLGNPRDLMKENIEKYVLELSEREPYGKIKSMLDAKKIRADESHEVVMLYSDDGEYLKSIQDNLDKGDYYFRNTNLEDLFMKLTGRKLNENQ